MSHDTDTKALWFQNQHKLLDIKEIKEKDRRLETFSFVKTLSLRTQHYIRE